MNFNELVTFIAQSISDRDYQSCEQALVEGYEYLNQEDKPLVDSVEEVSFYRLYIVFFTRFIGSDNFDYDKVITALSVLEYYGADQVREFELIGGLEQYCDIAFYERALDYHPNSMALLLGYANKMEEIRKYDVAIGCLHHALSVYPEANNLRLRLWDLQVNYSKQLLNKDILEEGEIDVLVDYAVRTQVHTVIEDLLNHDRCNLSDQQRNELSIAQYVSKDSFDLQECISLWEQKWSKTLLSVQSGIYLVDCFYSCGMLAQMMEVIETIAFKEEIPVDMRELTEDYVEEFFQSYNREDRELVVSYYNYKALYYKHQYELELALKYVNVAKIVVEEHPSILLTEGSILTMMLNPEDETALDTLMDAAYKGASLPNYLLEVAHYYDMLGSYHDVLSLVNSYHAYTLPTGESLYLQGKGYFGLGQYGQALKPLESAMNLKEDSPYRLSVNSLLMTSYKYLNDTQKFIEALQYRLSCFHVSRPEHWETRNYYVVFLYEMKAYEQCAKLIVQLHQINQLSKSNEAILYYLVDAEYLSSSEIQLPKVTEALIVQDPQSIEDYRANALYYWIMGDNLESAKAFEAAADLSYEKGFYLARAYWRTTYDTSLYEYSLALMERLKNEAVASIDYQMLYWQQNIYFRNDLAQPAYDSFRELIMKFPLTTMRKDMSASHYAIRQKINTEKLGNESECDRYLKMHNSVFRPS
ncbi:tetratricopeptide repeat protein [Myroides pelagicus]|uniref:Tetratricopeptide repeat protein n=1 Tax=Myroides pelagicus TaxID=270914 RepID=A0A7K1GPA9_9FLAO|nr:hypothetical protein [Myroides pelagicus]MTH30399.1 hypothetical protein [Myroides pelagicus]